MSIPWLTHSLILQLSFFDMKGEKRFLYYNVEDTQVTRLFTTVSEYKLRKIIDEREE